MPGFELIGQEEKKEVLDILETGIWMRYGFDQERRGVFKVRELEEAFCRYHGTSHALGVTSGSAALKVALEALDVGPGDEVIVPAFTFVATYEAVLEVGAIPVMADVDDSLNLSPEEIPAKITDRTKAVIPVHMCGAGARIDGILEAARKNGLRVLEDNAQSLGGAFQGRKLGTFGDMATFSFDYYKTITTGEGGMVITNRKDLYDRADGYHDHGHDHNPAVSRALEGRSLLGFNYRMNEFQGAVGLAQFRKLDTILARQRENKAFLKARLGGVSGITFRRLHDPEGDTATFLGFHLPDGPSAKAFQAALKEEGIDSIYYKENLWHYAPNWEHLLAWSTANSKKFPFINPLNPRKASYDREAIPHAEALLERTLFMAIPVILPDGRKDALARGIEKAGKKG